MIEIPWDLALSEHGDLIFAGGRDWQTVDGFALLNQRIITRLRMKRGSWIFNRQSTLGSDLPGPVMHMPSSQALGEIPNLVVEALEPMSDEINVKDVFTDFDELGQVNVVIEYTQVIPDAPPDFEDQAVLQLIIPISGVTA